MQKYPVRLELSEGAPYIQDITDFIYDEVLMFTCFYFWPRSRTLTFLLMVLIGGSIPSLWARAAAACDAPAVVCAWQDKIVGVKTPNMIASAIVIADGYILTNRHVAEDHTHILVRTRSGRIEKATALAHNMPADLVILKLENTSKPFELTEEISTAQVRQLYVVGFDQGRNGPRVYRPGEFAHYPDAENFKQARIHSDSQALPGNSGGAVVDENGNWVGILASGSGNINEIIPALHIPAVAEAIDESHQDAFVQRGRAIRICADTLYAAQAIARDPAAPIMDKIERNCLQSQNKQLFDQAGQLFGKWWKFDISEMFLQKSLLLDPNSPNTLMSLAVTYHLSRQAQKERPILKRYLEIDPQNAQALRLSVQVAAMLKDRVFAEQVLALMEKHNPAALPLAQSFVEQAFDNQKP